MSSLTLSISSGLGSCEPHAMMSVCNIYLVQLAAGLLLSVLQLYYSLLLLWEQIAV